MYKEINPNTTSANNKNTLLLLLLQQSRLEFRNFTSLLSMMV